MTTQEAVNMARQLAEHFRGRADGRRWRVWSDRARLLESAAADMAAEERAEREKQERDREIRERLRALLARMRPADPVMAGPFVRRRAPGVIVLPRNGGTPPDAA